jgi:tRNA threonylcarbamoyladenosine biosynthesis protein TsaE
MKREFVYSLDEIDRTVQEVYAAYQQHPVWLFESPMGSGKTTFIRALCKYLKVQDQVSSPTFGLVNEYETKAEKVYHFDLYRIKSEDELLEIGIDEYLDSGSLCLIEWPEFAKNRIESSYISLYFSFISESKRSLEITAYVEGAL